MFTNYNSKLVCSLLTPSFFCNRPCLTISAWEELWVVSLANAKLQSFSTFYCLQFFWPLVFACLQLTAGYETNVALNFCHFVCYGWQCFFAYSTELLTAPHFVVSALQKQSAPCYKCEDCNHRKYWFVCLFEWTPSKKGAANLIDIWTLADVLVNHQAQLP